MSVLPIEIVISRYCGDIGWADALLPHPITVYDKSQGGTRQRIHLPGWSSSDGPDEAPLWPGAVALPNLGCESHTHMHHIVERWETLADRTVFLSDDAPRHLPDICDQVRATIAGADDYVPYGPKFSCDADGRPHLGPDGFPYLREAYAIFFPKRPVPETFRWTGLSMYCVSRARVMRYSRAQWREARAWCLGKPQSLGMERMYDTLFG